MATPENCARCNHPLNLTQYEGSVIATCTACGCNVVSKQILRHIIRTREVNFDPQDSIAVTRQSRFGTPADIYESSLACPTCRQDLPAKYFAIDSAIVIHECEDCQLVYLDPPELELVQQFVEGIERLNSGDQ